jgi:hypothetical protein
MLWVGERRKGSGAESSEFSVGTAYLQVGEQAVASCLFHEFAESLLVQQRVADQYLKCQVKWPVF